MSLVLRNSSLVAEETGALVRRVAVDIGYVYNRKAAIRAKHSYLVGVVIPDLTNPFISDLTAGVDQVLNQAGWTSLLGISWESVSNQDRILLRMQEQNVDAIVLCPAVGSNGSTTAFLSRGVTPVLQVLRRMTGSLGYLGLDYSHGVALAVDHLVGLGHASIAFLGGGRSYSAAEERHRGYEDSMRRHGLVPSYVPCTLTRPAAAAAVVGLARDGRCPTAFVCFNDVVAIGAMAGIERAGLQVGLDVSVVGFDNIPECEFVRPQLTTIDTHARRLGEEAGALVLKGIHGPGISSEPSIVRTSLVARNTTATVRPGSAGGSALQAGSSHE